LSAGKYASPVHVGPYATLNLAYEALTQYVKSSGYEPTGVAYEFYFSGPETPPEEIRTQIACPLKAG
jgi:effector-binding domain-containing protein